MKNETVNTLTILRTEAGETQKETAAAVGVSLAALAAYEQGKRAPRDEIKRRLGFHFNVSPLSFL